MKKTKKRSIMCYVAAVSLLLTGFAGLHEKVDAASMKTVDDRNTKIQGEGEDPTQLQNGQGYMVSFVNAEGQLIGESFHKEVNESITLEEVPNAPIVLGKDFLGWYWGSSTSPIKYEGIFPMNLSTIPENIRTTLNGTIRLQPRYGKNIPANPLEKEGYRLIFDDEFDKTQLDPTKWVDRYLSSWSTTASRTNQWTMANGIMDIQITADTKPWCEEFDGQTVVTGFTTGQRNGLHNWTGRNRVKNPEDMQLTHINQYGYYEIRAKGQSGSSRHSAWWLIGFEDVPDESAEIDIFEILGNNNQNVPAALHAWNDPDAFVGGIPSYTDYNKDFNNEWHVYGFDWQQGTGAGAYPDKFIFYIDGIKVGEKHVNVDYPMIQLFSLYEKRAGGWTGNWEWMTYPNSFGIDYVRVYKKLPIGQPVITNDQLQVTNIKAEDLKLTKDQLSLKTYKKADGTVYTEKLFAGTKSYVRVDWNDGIETQEAVFWDEITQSDIDTLNNNTSVEKDGYIPSIDKTVKMQIQLIEGPPAPPYYMDNLLPRNANSLGYVFDGVIGVHGDNTPSGEFAVPGNDISAQESSITYDFQQKESLSGIDIWTNYGYGQGITKFKVAVWDELTKDWILLKNQQGLEEFTLDWGGNNDKDNQLRKLGVSFTETETSKVKIIITGANKIWENRFSIREIEFKK